MHQIKLFTGVEAEPSALERDVNDWIRESGVRVVSVQGNIAPQTPANDAAIRAGSRRFAASDVLIIVTYESD